MAQAKARHPDLKDRFFNVGFIINPRGKAILKHYKVSPLFPVEHSVCPHDVYDWWVEKYGRTLDAFWPVVDTEIGRLGIGSEVDWYAAYVLDLEQGEGCTKRREAVAKLRALGDPRAIPQLEAAIVRKGKTGKWKGKRINKCLQDAARAAIAFLAGVGDK